jgi:predicted CXXCH cytochrome family protein
MDAGIAVGDSTLERDLVMTNFRWFAAALVVTALAACTNEKIVFKTREPFNPPRDSINGFLGYYTVSSKLTTCGNCHVDQQGTWKLTKHASAWSNLVASGHQASYCNNCHSVSQLGNAVPDSIPAGYAKVADSTYFDVQCESCHGPGFTHVQGPNPGNVPLARISIPTDTSLSKISATCGACHTGVHEPFTEEWASSPHAGNVSEVISSYVTNPAGEAACMVCHEGRLTLKAWGVNTNYVERDQPITLATAMPVVCAVCHDPHAENNAGQLRWPIDNADPAQNLCMKCHNRRAVPSASSPRGPHAPQGSVVLGTAGWWGTNFVDTVPATHGNATANPRLCAGCHVNAVQGLDTAGVTTFSVGHQFLPDPCIVNGKPSGNNCARPGDVGYVSGSRAFTGCALSGCHNSAIQAENAVASQRAVVAALADALWDDNDGDESPYDTIPGGKFLRFDIGDTGLLTQLDSAQADTAFNYKDGKVSVAEGVLFNVRLLGEDRYANGDGSKGAHNPLLYQQLLATSIDQLKSRYGLPVPPAVQLMVDQTLAHVARVRGRPLAKISSR